MSKFTEDTLAKPILSAALMVFITIVPLFLTWGFLKVSLISLWLPPWSVLALSAVSIFLLYNFYVLKRRNDDELKLAKATVDSILAIYAFLGVFAVSPSKYSEGFEYKNFLHELPLSTAFVIVVILVGAVAIKLAVCLQERKRAAIKVKDIKSTAKASAELTVKHKPCVERIMIDALRGMSSAERAEVLAMIKAEASAPTSPT